ncbi:MAG: hypothetical protein IT293_07275 [Deltaproteobacteria bacterium]|nr:hypothetical protein [Deltaproteobacteria bacterium]
MKRCGDAVQNQLQWKWAKGAPADGGLQGVCDPAAAGCQAAGLPAPASPTDLDGRSKPHMR